MFAEKGGVWWVWLGGVQAAMAAMDLKLLKFYKIKAVLLIVGKDEELSQSDVEISSEDGKMKPSP